MGDLELAVEGENGDADVGKNKENLGFMRVCYPHFGAVDDPVVAVLLGAGLESKCVGARGGLGQAEGAELVGRE